MEISSHLDELIAVADGFRPELATVESVGQLLAAAVLGDGIIYTCGNGGSSTDAMHLAEELTGRFRHNRRPLAAVCLAADPSALTCIGNDFGFAEVFARPLQALARKGDWLVAFSTSGNSDNIVRALEVAHAAGIGSVLLTGESGGKAAALADHCIRVPASGSARIQEIHTFVLHAWMEIIEEKLAAAESTTNE